MTEDRDIKLHTIAPVYAPDSRVLILGSFPSVRSREDGFFYAHPQNRFWKVLAAVLGEAIPVSIDEKKELLLRNNIALWDVCASCSVKNSEDASIRDVKVNDIPSLIGRTRIHTVFTNGATATALYRRYLEKEIGIAAAALASTSAANASWTMERLISVWSAVGNALLKEKNNLL